MGTPCLPHGPKGIFVSGGAQIGTNCVIFQQVTIGSNTLSDTNGFGAPQIGDNCYMGAGAKIVGGITVGNNVRIAANAVVYESVPDNSVVLSGKQVTISREKPMDNRFYSYHGSWVYFQDEEWIKVTDPAVLNSLRTKNQNPAK
jgi:serine O-acetyltransferase